MANRNLKMAIVGSLLTFGLSSAPLADEPSASMLAQTCYGCHGPSGNSVGPASPSIAGMDPYVFVDTMNAFKSGDTYSTIMGRIAKGYTEEDFERMGEYFAEKEFVPVKQSYDQALVDKGAGLHEEYCENCHAEGGKALPEDGDYYILAGQWTPYLTNALSDFTNDRRILPKKMGRKYQQMVEEHGAEAVDALLAFYASEQ